MQLALSTAFSIAIGESFLRISFVFMLLDICISFQSSAIYVCPSFVCQMKFMILILDLVH